MSRCWADSPLVASSSGQLKLRALSTALLSPATLQSSFERLVMGAGMTTLPSSNGLMDLNWKNVYHAAKTSSTTELLRLLQDLASQHTIRALVNVGLVPLEGAFIDIDPQVWVQHVSNAVAMIEAKDRHSGSDAWQFISELLHLSLRRYASLPFEGAVLGMSPAERKLAFCRRLALFRSLLAISGFRQFAGEAQLQDTWDTCARSVTRDDPRFLSWLLVCAGATAEPDMSATPEVVCTAQRVIESQQKMWAHTLCGPRGGVTRLPRRIASSVQSAKTSFVLPAILWYVLAYDSLSEALAASAALGGSGGPARAIFIGLFLACRDGVAEELAGQAPPPHLPIAFRPVLLSGAVLKLCRQPGLCQRKSRELNGVEAEAAVLPQEQCGAGRGLSSKLPRVGHGRGVFGRG
eukprot:s5019_g1.t4